VPRHRRHGTTLRFSIVTRFAPAERAALADLLAAMGPDAPTLCEGWTTRDLAAHLVVRGSRADVAGGILIPALAPSLRRVQAKVATRPWETLLAQVRRRPPLFVGPFDELANRTEYYVHHEDIRRAQPGWAPRSLAAGQSAALWSSVRSRSRLVLRRTPARVDVSAPGHGSLTAGRGGPAVSLTGEPQELLLFLFGRQAHALVSLDGPAAVVDRMRGARYGI
jgi:uncharacterized protein (TIGR03085 family)